VPGVASTCSGGRIDLVFQRIFDVATAFALIIMTLARMLTVSGFSISGDALRDALDPRPRDR